jgi:hypothetical protein
VYSWKKIEFELHFLFLVRTNCWRYGGTFTAQRFIDDGTILDLNIAGVFVDPQQGVFAPVLFDWYLLLTLNGFGVVLENLKEKMSLLVIGKLRYIHIEKTWCELAKFQNLGIKLFNLNLSTFLQNFSSLASTQIDWIIRAYWFELCDVLSITNMGLGQLGW